MRLSAPIVGLTALLLLLASPLHALVYQLKADTSPAGLRRALRAEVVLEEPVVMNGRKGTMFVAVSELDWVRLLDELRPLLADFGARENAASLILDGPGEDGTRVRHLIVRGEPGKLATIFTMTLPDEADMPDLDRLWPDQLPQPRQITVQSVISMTKRGVDWAQFEGTGDSRQLLQSYQDRLVGAGWHRLAGDDTSSVVCMSPDQTHMAVVSIRAGKTRVYGSVFLRRIK